MVWKFVPVLLLTSIACGRVGFELDVRSIQSDAQQPPIIPPQLPDAQVPDTTRDASIPDATPLIPPAVQDDCPANYSFRLSSCYQHVNASVTWLEAQEACQSHALGSHLVQVNDSNEAAFVDGFAPSNERDHWHGSSSRVEEGEFLYVDGTPQTLDIWANGHPVAKLECVVYVDNRTFESSDCNRTNTYMCEYDGVAANANAF